LKLTGPLLKPAAALLAAALLAACSNSVNGVRFTKDGDTGGSGTSKPQPIRNLTAAEISAAIVGKTFQYTRADGNGFVTYNADGTFNFQDDAKGSGTGTWTAGDGQFCEVFGAGAPQDCGEFKSTGDAYFAAKSRLVEMKV
jgi:predicted small secreted protein